MAAANRRPQVFGLRVGAPALVVDKLYVAGALKLSGKLRGCGLAFVVQAAGCRIVRTCDVMRACNVQLSFPFVRSQHPDLSHFALPNS